MDGSISNLLAQGFAREKWYKKGLEDAKNYLDPLFQEKQRHISLAAKTEANINAYKNSSIMKGGSPGYGIYDTKTNLLSFYQWAETIRKLKAAYDNEEDAIYDIADKLAPNNLEDFVDGERQLENPDWFRPGEEGKKSKTIADFETSYLFCNIMRKGRYQIPGIKTPLKGMIFGDDSDLVLIKVVKNIELEDSKLFAQQYVTSGSAKLIKQEGESGGKVSDYPILTPEQTKKVLLFESQEDDKSFFSLTKMIKTAFFSPAEAAEDSDDHWGSDAESELEDL
jgi:hypothetical protein